MTEKTTYRLQVILPEEWRGLLSAMAHEKYVSVQKLIEGTIHDLLEQGGKLDKPQAVQGKKRKVP